MVAPEQVELLRQGLERTFTLPVSMMTFREVQMAVTTAFPNQPEVISTVIESLIKGELSSSMQAPNLKEVVQDYAMRVRVSKEVAEYGEFINSFSCDVLPQGNKFFFLNRMRRIDGTDYHFLSAPEINIRLAHMFINRLRELKKQVGGLSMEKNVVDELKTLINDIDDLLK